MKDLDGKGLEMPKSSAINTITLGIFSDDNVSVICENTIKLERVSVTVLNDNSEVGKSFLALKFVHVRSIMVVYRTKNSDNFLLCEFNLAKFSPFPYGYEFRELKNLGTILLTPISLLKPLFSSMTSQKNVKNYTKNVKFFSKIF